MNNNTAHRYEVKCHGTMDILKEWDNHKRLKQLNHWTVDWKYGTGWRNKQLDNYEKCMKQNEVLTALTSDNRFL
jgi:hypothetical protein